MRTKNSAINLNVSKTGDGFLLQGGISGRSLIVQGGDVSFNGGQVLDGQILIGNSGDNSFNQSYISGAGNISVINGSSSVIISGSTSESSPNPVELGLALDSTISAATAGTGKLCFDMPHNMNITGFILSLSHAYPAPAGSNFLVDINTGYNPVSILNARISVSGGEYTSLTSPSQAVIGTGSIPFGTRMQIDIDQVGASTAGTGPILFILGTRY